jgi:hypothetical protein
MDQWIVEIVKGIVEIVKTSIDRVFSWPVAVFVLGWMFGDELKDFLGRVLKLGLKHWVHVEVAPTHNQADAKPPDKGLEVGEVEPTVVEMWHGGNPVVREREQLIRDEIDRAKLDDQKIIPVLINRLAVIQLLLSAEQIYRMIFGSQIALLKQLNTSGPVPRAQFMSVYNNAKARWSNAYTSYSFDQYVGFLLNQGLIISIGDGYAITNAGREFLKWMAETGVVEDKLL